MEDIKREAILPDEEKNESEDLLKNILEQIEKFDKERNILKAEDVQPLNTDIVVTSEFLTDEAIVKLGKNLGPITNFDQLLNLLTKKPTEDPICSCGNSHTQGCTCPDCLTPVLTTKQQAEEYSYIDLEIPNITLPSIAEVLAPCMGIMGDEDITAGKKLLKLISGEYGYFLTSPQQLYEIEYLEREFEEAIKAQDIEKANTLRFASGPEAFTNLIVKTNANFEKGKEFIAEQLKEAEESLYKNITSTELEHPLKNVEIIKQKISKQKDDLKTLNLKLINALEQYSNNQNPDMRYHLESQLLTIYKEIKKLDNGVQEGKDILRKAQSEAYKLRDVKVIIENLRTLMLTLSGLKNTNKSIYDLINYKLVVVPASVRPIKNGNFPGSNDRKLGPLNVDYKDILIYNEQIKTLKDLKINETSYNYRNACKLLQDKLIEYNNDLQSLLLGKEGYIQNKLQGYVAFNTGRGVIVADDSLGPNIISVAPDIGFAMYKDLITDRLKKIKAENEEYENIDINYEIKEKTDLFKKTLSDFINEGQYVISSRQPELSEDSIRVEKIILNEDYDSKVVKINPTICEALNADFDGDTYFMISALGEKAINELKSLIKYQNFSRMTGNLLTAPTLESVLGLYLASREEGEYSFARDTYVYRIKDNSKEEKQSKVFVKDVILHDATNENPVCKPYKENQYLFTNLQGEKIFAKSEGVLEKTKDGTFIFISHNGAKDWLEIPLNCKFNIKEGDFIPANTIIAQKPPVLKLSFNDVIQLKTETDENNIDHLIFDIKLLEQLKQKKLSYNQKIDFEGTITTPGRLVIQLLLYQKSEYKEIISFEMAKDLKKIQQIENMKFDFTNDFSDNYCKIQNQLELVNDNIQTLLDDSLLINTDEKIINAYNNYIEKSEELDAFSNNGNVSTEEYNNAINLYTESIKTLHLVNQEFRKKQENIINKAIISDINKNIIPIKETLDKKELKKYLLKYINNPHGEDFFNNIINSFSRIGFVLAGQMDGATFSSQLQLNIENITKNYFDKYNKNNILKTLYDNYSATLTENEKKNEQTYESFYNHLKFFVYDNKIGPNIKKELSEYIKTYKNNPFINLIVSGAKGSINNIMKLCVHYGWVKNNDNLNFVGDSYFNGYSAESEMLTYYSNLAGLNKGRDMSSVGGLERLIRNAQSELIISEDDCGTTEGITVKKSSNWGHELISFTSRDDVVDDNNNTIIPKGKIITKEDLQLAEKAGITSITKRSPSTCSAENGFCSKCYGAKIGFANQETTAQVSDKLIKSVTAALSQKLMDLHKNAGSNIESNEEDPLTALRGILEGVDPLICQNVYMREKPDSASPRGQTQERATPLEMTNIITQRLEECLSGGDINRKSLEILASCLFKVRIVSIDGVETDENTKNNLLSPIEYNHLKQHNKNSNIKTEIIYIGARNLINKTRNDIISGPLAQGSKGAMENSILSVLKNPSSVYKGTFGKTLNK